MKGQITTLLSLTGVLVAGSAAALVNTQVLQSNGTSTGGGSTIAGTAAPAPVNAATQAIYQVGDSGLVTLDTAGGVLTVVSVTPSTGWVFVKAENSTTSDIAVQLQSGNTLVDFKANLLQGVVTTSVESKNLTVQGTGTPAATQPTVAVQPPAVVIPPATSTNNTHNDNGEGGQDD
jgi:hypothetical protein